jgi:hypothetical protein
MTRHTHLVGAWPGLSGNKAMETALQRLGPYLDRLSDGETGFRSMWATPNIEAFRANPDVELVRDADFTGMDDITQYRVRDGANLDADNIRLTYLGAFKESFPNFKVLRDRHGRPDLRFQVGIPTPLDLAVFTFGGEEALGDAALRTPIEDATVRQIDEIFAIGGDEVVFQLEAVVALVSVAQAPDAQQPEVADGIARELVRVAARGPEGARYGIHLCLGDFTHKAYGHMRDVRPLVRMANAIAIHWPAGRSLDYVHAPFAAAEEPPTFDAGFYEPLRDLELPDQTRFVAGFVHEHLDLDQHVELLARIEGLVGHGVDVAAACGLGRRPSPDEAWDAMDKSAALIEARV